jgi:EAL domain-containing protein (putative c-di-GMP-specific phosphodiesterase class I)
LFDPSQEAAAEYRRRLEDDLRAAIGRRELELYCQPIVDLATQRVAGGEALLRWRHPQLGPISPEIFVPLAEQIGLIDEVGYWVLEEACRNVALWRTQKLALYASVNVSARQIPEGLPVPAVLDLLARYGLPPSAIALEITEGVLMSDVTVAQTWVNDLRRAGLRVFMDDFGTGYSSLSYLKRFPLDVVKIDKSFISDPQQGSNEFALVEAIITMARSLGLQVVAEGIEDEFQLRELCRLGCGYGQGYFFSRPVAMLDFVATAARLDADRPGA